MCGGLVVCFVGVWGGWCIGFVCVVGGVVVCCGVGIGVIWMFVEVGVYVVLEVLL